MFPVVHTSNHESRITNHESQIALMEPLVLFEDDHLLAVNKPAGVNTHAPDVFAPEGLHEWLQRRRGRPRVAHGLSSGWGNTIDLRAPGSTGLSRASIGFSRSILQRSW